MFYSAETLNHCMEYKAQPLCIGQDNGYDYQHNIPGLF